MSTQITSQNAQDITLAPNKLTSLVTSWQRRFVKGNVAIGHSTYNFEATIDYLVSRLIGEYDSADGLPPDMLARYRELNPTYLHPSDLVDGSLLRERSSPPVYVIFGRAKFNVPNPETLHRLYNGWANVKVVGDDALLNVSLTPGNGTVLRDENDPHVWLIEDGQRRHITSPSILNSYGGWAAVRVVPPGATTRFQTGAPVA